MAAGDESRLSNTQIARLTQAVAVSNMESIAMLYLNIDWEDLENLRVKHRENVATFNRDVIIKWAYKNQSTQQVKVNKNTLFIIKKTKRTRSSFLLDMIKRS